MNLKKAIVIGVLLLPAGTRAAPFLTSDPYVGTPLPTHCGIFMDAAPVIQIAITKDAKGTYCKYDLVGLTAGPHTFKATHILIDPVWGKIESVQSSPLSVSRPGNPAAPVNLHLE